MQRDGFWHYYFFPGGRYSTDNSRHYYTYVRASRGTDNKCGEYFFCCIYGSARSDIESCREGFHPCISTLRTANLRARFGPETRHLSQLETTTLYDKIQYHHMIQEKSRINNYTCTLSSMISVSVSCGPVGNKCGEIGFVSGYQALGICVSVRRPGAVSGSGLTMSNTSGFFAACVFLSNNANLLAMPAHCEIIDRQRVAARGQTV